MTVGRVLPAGCYGYHDIMAGDRIRTGSAHITAELIDNFAELSGDRYAIHLELEAARASGFDNRVAHGLLVLSVVDGLKNNAEAKLLGLVSLGWNWRFEHPVLLSDIIRCEMTITRKRIIRSNQRGIVQIEFDVLNQSNQRVQCGHNELLFNL